MLPRMITSFQDSDAFLAARMLIDRFGADARAVAAKTAMEASVRGDVERRMFSRMVCDAVSDLLRCKRMPRDLSLKLTPALG
jgi:hypothetical protein